MLAWLYKSVTEVVELSILQLVYKQLVEKRKWAILWDAVFAVPK